MTALVILLASITLFETLYFLPRLTSWLVLIICAIALGGVLHGTYMLFS